MGGWDVGVVRGGLAVAMWFEMLAVDEMLGWDVLVCGSAGGDCLRSLGGGEVSVVSWSIMSVEFVMSSTGM